MPFVLFSTDKEKTRLRKPYKDNKPNKRYLAKTKFEKIVKYPKITIVDTKIAGTK